MWQEAARSKHGKRARGERLQNETRFIHVLVKPVLGCQVTDRKARDRFRALGRECMVEKVKRGSERRPSRRSFLKLATSAGVTAALGVGARGHEGSPQDLGEVVLSLEAWRVRPGGEMVLDVKSQRGAVPREVAVKLVELDSEGRVITYLGMSAAGRALSASGEGRHWRGQIKAPSIPQTGREVESFLMAAAITGQDGHVTLSNSVEVICTPQCAGA